jgi:4-hydroxybutyrate dehydrogenase
VIEFNAATVPDQLERIRTILDPQAKTAAAAVRALRARIGLPSHLGAQGVVLADVAKLADKAFEDACHRSNPRPTSRDDLAALYTAAL